MEKQPQEMLSATGRVTETPVKLPADSADSSGNRNVTGGTNTNASGAPRRVSAQRRHAATAAKKQQEKIAIISLCATAVVLLITVVVIISTMLFKAPADDGLIFKHVFAAGVDLGGMTKEQAKAALHEATDDTYSHLDMVVQVLDSTITLSPKDTGARLDVNAVVEAAYNYGRTGSRSEQEQARLQAQNSTYTISLLPYLSLDTTYIQSAVRNLGMSYSTTLSQTTWEIKGERPSTDVTGDVDTQTAFQTLYIHMGTAEYGLVTDKLYEQIMDAYNINIFQVVGECSMVAPDELDYEQIYSQLCIPPVDATIDPVTYVVTPEKYGYGFTLETLKSTVENAEYNSVVTIPLKFITPNITSDIISGDLFQNALSSFQTALSENADWNLNMQLACDAINGYIVRSGEEFSLNTILGELTTEAGYRDVETLVGKFNRVITGGGVSQVATTLYNAAILADMTIVERHNHVYAPSYVNAGFDATVLYGKKDLRFVNSYDLPIKIQASIVDGFLNIDLIGTDNRDYRVEITYEVVNTTNPGTLLNIMLPGNAAGYKEGDVLVEGIPGTTIRTMLCKYTRDTFTLISKTQIAESEYEKRDKVVVEYYEAPTTDPSDPTESTGASDPTESTGSTSSTSSSDPTSSDPTSSTRNPFRP